MSMMSKLTAHDDDPVIPFKPKIYQSKRKGQIRNIYDRCNYGQRNYQNRYRSNSGDRRIKFNGRFNIDIYRDSHRYNQNYRNDFRRGNFGGNLRANWNYREQNFRGYRRNYRNENYERGSSGSRERQFSNNIRRNDRNSSSRSRSGLRANTNRDRIKCYKCREYNNCTKDCPSSKLGKETEQVQQMYNMDEEQTSLKTLATDTYDSIDQVTSISQIGSDHLN